ncbi:MAG: hypothetical protein ACLSHC_09815 [Bilophila wadsworthia]
MPELQACLIACQQRNACPTASPATGCGNAQHGFALRLALPARSLYALRRAVLR